MPGFPTTRPVLAGVLGCATFLLIGWSGLLVPSMIRSVKESFGQSDAGIGAFYFAYAAAYAAGSFGGGIATERFGRRAVLGGATAVHALGLLALGLGPSWLIFLAAAIPDGLGAGMLDGGVNGLFLDRFRTGRGRALNLLHLFFSIGALSAPLAVGLMIERGIAWQAILIGTALAAVPVAVLFGVIAMPAGTRSETSPRDAAPGARLSAPLVLLGLAIACYVASEVGVSSWLVRFLEPAPLTTATTGLSLFWAGLAAGRLVSSQLADRFDHLRFVAVSSGAVAASLVGAIFIPSLGVSIGLFALAGFASGPIFPMIIAIGGERYPDRSAAVSGFLTGSAVIGSIIYPPVMGFLSVTVGLTVAMAGNVILAIACGGAILLAGRSARSRSRRAAAA